MPFAPRDTDARSHRGPDLRSGAARPADPAGGGEPRQDRPHRRAPANPRSWTRQVGSATPSDFRHGGGRQAHRGERDDDGLKDGFVTARRRCCRTESHSWSRAMDDRAGGQARSEDRWVTLSEGVLPYRRSQVLDRTHGRAASNSMRRRGARRSLIGDTDLRPDVDGEQSHRQPDQRRADEKPREAGPLDGKAREPSEHAAGEGA